MLQNRIFSLKVTEKAASKMEGYESPALPACQQPPNPELIVWLFTNIGFFSVVQKMNSNELTVRARVRRDLEILRKRYLPELGQIITKSGTDYPWRATVSHVAFAAGLAQIAMDCTYPNYKNEVAKRQGKERAHRYAAVWSALHGLKDEAQPGEVQPEKPIQPHPRVLTRFSPGSLPVITEAQAGFTATLIRELGDALLRHYGTSNPSELPRLHRSINCSDLPEYGRLMYGLIALGWVFDEYVVEEKADLKAIHARPEEHLGRASLHEIRRYLHCLQRSEKWADASMVPVVEAYGCGALEIVARRLTQEFRPWENPEPNEYALDYDLDSDLAED